VRFSGGSAQLPDDWAGLKGLGEHPRVDGSVPYADPLDLLPVPRRFFPSVPVGETPLWQPLRLREELGLPGLFIKDDSANPTGSLKDRASFLVAAFALQHGLKDVVLASTGNAGSSMSGLGAAAGLNIRLYLPASAPQAKIVQALQYGADVHKVDGTYDDAYDESSGYVEKYGGLSRNTAYNPMTVEGKKTVSLEIFRQLGASIPDIVYVPVGDGVIISGVYKGFEDLVALGLADRVPHVVCVQAEGSSAIARALESGSFGKPRRSDTVADSISVDVPRGGLFALGRLERHGGRAVVVSDGEILSAQKRLSSSAGLFAEPAAAAAFAGLLKDMEAGAGSSAVSAGRGKTEAGMPDRMPGKDKRIVVLVTGSGLKDINGALKALKL
jgi:threonine synthase